MNYWVLSDSLSEIWSIVVGEPVAEVALETELVDEWAGTAVDEVALREGDSISFVSAACSLETFMFTFILHCQHNSFGYMVRDKFKTPCRLV